MAHFSDCGKRCEHPYCGQQDMLPFQCDACGKTYCSHHLGYEAHSCPKGHASKDRRVIVCPLCTTALPHPAGEDENAIWERHMASGNCKPREPAKSNRCPVKGCKEKLTFSNSCSCGTCGIKVCLKHRFEDQHECKPCKPARSGQKDACRVAAARAADARAMATKGTQFLAGAGQQLRRLVK
eukprot:TRINITY_DN4893_c0_g1_i1.p1 TRINITY_DN4893_c0_g1~~TRINITY_DN4893_c0_g1_i1.p1  ORF type:complete len:205 (-),score=30.18 TRINITY_DN4893_c0_g1_i1:57-602(-)